MNPTITPIISPRNTATGIETPYRCMETTVSHVFAVGGNATAARFSGINIKKVKIMVWTISGFLASFGGVILASRMSSGQPAVGPLNGPPVFIIERFQKNQDRFFQIFESFFNSIGSFLAGILLAVLIHININRDSSFLASFGGVILASRMSSGQPAVGIGFETDAIAAAVLGGTSMYGGPAGRWRSGKPHRGRHSASRG